jgi:hypothetical protein
MKHEQQVVLKRWIPILEEYEKTKAKHVPRVFKSIKALCDAHYISPKELRRYCSAPPKSSHKTYLLSPIFCWAPVT